MKNNFQLKIHFRYIKNRLWLALANSKYGVFLLQLFVYLTKKDIGFVNNKTKLVIEGFPRSGNTYAYAAFISSQPESLVGAVGHHVHGTSQIDIAIKNKTPILVIIREPEKSISSLLIRNPFISAKQACLDYLYYYNYIKLRQEDIVIVDFDRIINQFPCVIDDINNKFSTNFEIPEIDEDFKSHVFSIVKNMDIYDQKNNKINASSVAIPSEERKQKSIFIIEKIKEKERLLFDQCQALYKEILT